MNWKTFLNEAKEDKSTEIAKELETILKSNKIGHVVRSIDEVKIQLGNEVGEIDLYWNDKSKEWQVIFEKRFNIKSSIDDLVKQIKNNTLDKKWKMK